MSMRQRRRMLLATLGGTEKVVYSSEKGFVNGKIQSYSGNVSTIGGIYLPIYATIQIVDKNGNFFDLSKYSKIILKMSKAATAPTVVQLRRTDGGVAKYIQINAKNEVTYDISNNSDLVDIYVAPNATDVIFSDIFFE